MDPAKLKVVELRSELSKLGLDTKGNKAVLVERLRKALKKQTDPVEEESVPIDSQKENSQESKMTQDEKEKSPEPPKVVASPTKPTGRSPRSSTGGTPTKTTPTRGSPKTILMPVTQKTPSPAKSPIIEKPPPTIIQPPTQPEIIDEIPNEEPEKEKKSDNSVLPQNPDEKSITESTKVDVDVPQVAEEIPKIVNPPEEISNEPEVVSNEPEVVSNESEVVSNEKDVKDIPEIVNEPKETIEQVPQATEELENTVDKIIDKAPEEKAVIEDSCTAEVSTDPENVEKNQDEAMDTNEIEEKVSVSVNEEIANKEDKENLKSETEDKKPVVDELKKELDVHHEKEVSQDVDMKPCVKQEDTERESKDQDRKDRKDRKRKRSTSSQDERHKSPPPPSKMDDEPEIDYSIVLLSWYDSDLNLVIDKTKFLSATPMHNDGFGYVWAGARASFGFTSGKVYYEVKITHQCNVTLPDEEYPHVLRAGWSVAFTSMQLGEEKFSYGYGGTGKISTGNNFKDYGPSFGLNDILGCYLDMENDEHIIISYTLNGESLGEAFKILKNELGGKALFPHVLTKNCGFVCNFGDEAPWHNNTLENYVPVGLVDLKDRVPGPQRPEKREDCEMLMMCGLPAAGKTVWATKYAAENSEKMYNILGTNNLIDKMKVIGLPRRRNYHGRWEVLIDKCTRCLNKLLEVAATRRRNYILDQTNVYPSAQRRKMRHFYGFQRKAIVIVPTEEEFKTRTEKREAVEGKDVPDSAVLEMKANFSAPVVGESFDSVEWVELGEEEAKKLITKYNKEGKDAGYTQQVMNKRPRFEKSSDSHRDSRDIRSTRDSRDSRDHRDRRSAYSDRNRNSTWRGGSHMGGGGGGGGWRDRAPRGGPPHMRHSTAGYGGSPSSGWRGRGGPSAITPHRGSSDRRINSNDRRSGMSERSRSGTPRQGGGWGPMNSSSSYHNSSSSSGGWGGSQSSGGWSSGQSQQQGNWGSSQSSGSWGQQQQQQQQQNWGNWKGYGQSNYNQNNYSQQGYGNGNWSSWNQQYYNQYWGQQQSASQSSTTSGGTAITSGSAATTPSTASTGSTYNSYPQGWQGYTQSYYSTDNSNSSTQQQK